MKYKNCKAISALVVRQFLIVVFAFNMLYAGAQHLAPGFDAVEYYDMLRIDFDVINDREPEGQDYKLSKGLYSKYLVSPEVGLYNKCAVLIRDDNTAIICLRGTVGKPESWIENFYAAMVPATGSLQLNNNRRFDYKLASDEKAQVHVGWLMGLGYLSGYIDSAMQMLLQKGISNFIVTGHSQGAALAFLTCSYLYYRYQKANPSLQFKTYASAAPKPGNLFYAYDFDYITSGGYGYRIVNTADWVPETPLSVQTLNDFNDVSVIKDADRIIKKQKFGVRLAANHLYNRMNCVSRKTMRVYRKYLGGLLYKQASKTLPGFEEPVYSFGSNYMTAGTPIVLYADEDYYAKFKFDGKDYFVHHLLKPYEYLLLKQYPQ